MAVTPVNITGATTIVGFTVTPPFVTTDVYTFSFPYISQEDFEITVNSETTLDAADFEFTSDYLIQLTTTGVNKLNALYSTEVPMIIRRRTELSSRLVDYEDGATLTEADLDLAANQLFYLIQEVYDSTELGNVDFNPVDGSIDFDGVVMLNIGYPTGESAAATLGAVYDNVITPDYTSGDTYRTGRMVFYLGDLYRANTDISPAPASFNAPDWDVVLTAAQLTQIATNTADIATNTADIATNTAAIATNASNFSTHAADDNAHREVDTKSNLETWASGASNGAQAFASDEKKAYQVIDGALSEIGSGGAGDADTVHLKRAASDGIDLITLYSTNSTLPDFEGASAFGVDEGDILVPSSGSEAMLSNDDDHAVYKFASEANSQYSAFGAAFAIPRALSGKDVVLEHLYRTADTSGESQDADYMVWVWDAINGFNSTTTSSGAVSAGTTITITDDAGKELAIGQKGWFGTSSGVIEGHITYVVDNGTSWDIKFSEDVTLTSGDRFATGVITDVLTTLDAADDDTYLSGKKFKVVVNVPEGCLQLNVMFQQLTSQTDSFLYVDNILISSEVVKRVFAKDKPITVRAEGNGGTSITDAVTDIDFTEVFDSDNAWDGTGFTAPRTGYYSVEGGVQTTAATNARVMAYVDGTLSKFLSAADLNTNVLHFSGILYLQKGEEFTCRINSTNTLSNSSSAHYIVITETAQQVNDVVVVESTDSVMSEWTDAGAITIDAVTTSPTKGTVGNDNMKWRRVGDSMHIRFAFNNSGGSPSNGSGDYLFKMPSGYKIDLAKIDSENSSADQVTGATVGSAFVATTSSENANFASIANVTVYDEDYVRLVHVGINTGGGTNITSKNVGSDSFQLANNPAYTADYVVPIAGWDANPKPLLSFPTITYGQDAEVFRATDWAGTGSTNTSIPYFNNVQKNTISNLGTITNDSTNGCYFTASKRCIVKGSHWLAATSTMYAGFSLGEPTTDIPSISEANMLGYHFQGDANLPAAYSLPSYILEAGETIYAHGINGRTPNGTAANGGVIFVVEPEEGQQNQAAIIAQPVAFVEDRKPAGTHGGTSSITVATRDLNTLSGDIAAVGVTLSSNQFTLPAGKFYIEWDSQFYRGDYVATEIYNITDSKQESLSVNMYSNGSDSQANYSSGSCVLTITKNTTFELRYEVATSQASTGLGLASGSGGGALSIVGYEKYSQVKITRMK